MNEFLETLSSDMLRFSLKTTCLHSCESALGRGGSGAFYACEDPRLQVPVWLPQMSAATEKLFWGVSEFLGLLPQKVKFGILKMKCRKATWRQGKDDVVVPWSPFIICLPLPPLFLSCQPPLFSVVLKLVQAAWKNREC